MKTAILDGSNLTRKELVNAVKIQWKDVAVSHMFEDLGIIGEPTSECLCTTYIVLGIRQYTRHVRASATRARGCHGHQREDSHVCGHVPMIIGT